MRHPSVSMHAYTSLYKRDINGGVQGYTSFDHSAMG